MKILKNRDIRVLDTEAISVTIVAPHDGKPGRFDVRLKAFGAKPAKSSGVGAADVPDAEPETERVTPGDWTGFLNLCLGRKVD